VTATGVESADVIFEPLQFRTLTVKNRIFRSSVGGRLDYYDGSGSDARINWELKFARGGVGAIISSFCPVTIRGRVVPGFATIDRDDRIPFWRELGKRVHEHGCKYILQLSHSGRQQDIIGIEHERSLSPTSKPESIHGLRAERMTVAQIKETVAAFAAAARRAREAGLDGLETHSAHGYLFTQFLSSAINDRKDEYGGPIENRARFLLEVVGAIRAEVGRDFHLQAKISATEHNNALFPWEKKGNTLEESIQVCKWLEEAGVDALHVSAGGSFPHPHIPAGDFPVDVAGRVYGGMLSSGAYTLRNLLIFRTPGINQLYRWWWRRNGPDNPEGAILPDSRAIKDAVNIPVLCTGGFQTASVIRSAIVRGDCDGVTIARPLVANNDLVNVFAQGYDRAPRPCTYCNRCLVNIIMNPIGCYEERRYSSREEMVRQILSVFDPDAPPTNGDSRRAAS
jgi:2,4-dienoyl-CoA reductase (NADPH2)